MAQTLNTEVTRYEAPRKVAGEVRYAADFMPVGMFHGALAVSPIAKGKLTGIDIAAAQAEAGVVAVFTHETLPKYQTPKGFYAGGPRAAARRWSRRSRGRPGKSGRGHQRVLPDAVPAPQRDGDLPGG